jgi:F0F1-type ATP synthase assembly protein I
MVNLWLLFMIVMILVGFLFGTNGINGYIVYQCTKM